MSNTVRTMRFFGVCIVAMTAALLAGCQMNKSSPQASNNSMEAKSTTMPAMANTPQPARPAIRIDAGAAQKTTDSAGNVWLADTGFTGGETVERASDMTVQGAADPTIYRTEHYGMTGFSYSVPNGKYLVKLHFAETSSAISGPGDRVFSINVEGHDIKDLDIWKKAGGAQHAYVETVPVTVNDGKLDITFTAGTQNTEINGIEIIPAS